MLPFPRKANSFPSRLGEFSIVKFSRFFLLLLSAAARSHRTCCYYYIRLRLNVCLPRRYFQHLHLDLTLKKIQQRKKKTKWAAAAVSERKRGRGKWNLNKRKLLEFLATHQKVFFYVPACTWFLVIIFRILINCIYRSCKHKIWSVYTFKNCGIFENIKLSHTHTAQAIKLKATLKILFIILFMYVKHFTWFAVVVCRWGYKYRCEEKN